MGSKKKSTGGATANKRAATWYTTDLLRLQGGSHPEGKEETGVDRRLPEWRNTNVPPGAMGPDRVYLVQVVAGRAWAPEDRIWAPEVFIVGEGIHFKVDDSVRLMPQLNHANIIAAELGVKTYEH